MRFQKWHANLAVAIALAALVGWSAWERWMLLTETPYPVGIDGYFYAVQLRSILEHGHLAYAASPLAFWLLAPFAWLTDPITGAKLGAAVLGAAVAIPAFAVGRRLGGSRATGLFAAALTTPSAGSFYLSIEFVKNGIGLTVAVVYVWLLLRACDPRPLPVARVGRRRLSSGSGRIAAAAIALVAAYLTHKMAAGIALLVTVPAIATAAWPRVKRRTLFLAGAAVAPLVLISLIVLVARLLPGRVLGLRELGLFDDLFTTRFDPYAPALALPNHTLWMGHEAIFAGVAALLLIVAVIVRAVLPERFRDHPVPAPALAVALAFAALGLVIALPWLDVHDAQGLGFRLRVAAFVPMAIAAATFVGLVGALVPRDVRIAAIVAFAVVWAIAQPGERGEGVVRTHPALATAVQALARDLPEDAIVVCPERHIVFMAAWYARADVRLRPEAVPVERRWRLLPLAFIGKDSALDRTLRRARDIPGIVPPVGLHPRHPDGLVILPESTWEWVLDQLPTDAQTRLRRWHTI